MKRILLILGIVLGVLTLALPAYADGKVWTLYLHRDMSGVSTAPSGTSTMVVEGGGVDRSRNVQFMSNLDRLSSESWVVQIEDLALCQSALSAGGDNSGATFTLRYKESIYTGSNHWDQATTMNVFNGTALSGSTRVQQQIYPVAMGSMQWEFISGITAFSGVTVRVVAYDQK